MSVVTSTLDYKIFTFHELVDSNGVLNNTAPDDTIDTSSSVELTRTDVQNFVIKVQRVSCNIDYTQLIVNIYILNYQNVKAGIQNGKISGTLYDDYSSLKNGVSDSFVKLSTNNPNMELEISLNTEDSGPLDTSATPPNRKVDLSGFNNGDPLWIHLKLEVGGASGLAGETDPGQNHKIKILDDLITIPLPPPNSEREFSISGST